MELWRGRSNCAKKLPLLGAVQVKRGPRKLTSWVSTRKDIEDLETLYTSENLEKPVLYFLEWVDHGLQKHENDRQDYREVQSRLKNGVARHQTGVPLLSAGMESDLPIQRELG